MRPEAVIIPNRRETDEYVRILSTAEMTVKSILDTLAAHKWFGSVVTHWQTKEKCKFTSLDAEKSFNRYGSAWCVFCEENQENEFLIKNFIQISAIFTCRKSYWYLEPLRHDEIKRTIKEKR